MAFIGRPRFRESEVLGEFVRRTAPSAEITEAAISDGSFIDAVDSLLDAERPTGQRINGADEAAAAILERFGEVLR